MRNRIWIVAYNESKSRKKSTLEKAAWSTQQLGKSADGLSSYLWQPHRQTYIDEMAGKLHGIPSPVGEFKCLGNSIVPQVAQVFARAIYQELTR